MQDYGLLHSMGETVKTCLTQRSARLHQAYPRFSITVTTLGLVVETGTSTTYLLHNCYKRLKDHKLTLWHEKCEFGKVSIDFHGHLFTQEGLKPSPTNIQAVQNCAPPASKEELVCFLQMVAYLFRYISNFSSRYEPLQKLTEVNTKFEWLTEQDKALKDLNAAITAAPVLILYHSSSATEAQQD